MMMLAETATGAPPSFPVNSEKPRVNPDHPTPTPARYTIALPAFFTRLACLLSTCALPPTPSTTPAPPHNAAAARLRAQIFAGALAPGSFLDEAALCERLAISRTPLREALKVLVAEGLLRHESRRGCFVAEVRERDLDEIFPVMALLEGRAAHEAPRRVGGAGVAALEALH